MQVTLAIPSPGELVLGRATSVGAARVRGSGRRPSAASVRHRARAPAWAFWMRCWISKTRGFVTNRRLPLESFAAAQRVTGSVTRGGILSAHDRQRAGIKIGHRYIEQDEVWLPPCDFEHSAAVQTSVRGNPCSRIALAGRKLTGRHHEDVREFFGPTRERCRHARSLRARCGRCCLRWYA